MQALTYNRKSFSIRQSRSSKQSPRVLFNESVQYQHQYLALAATTTNSSPSHVVLPLYFQDLRLEILYQELKTKFSLRIYPL